MAASLLSVLSGLSLLLATVGLYGVMACTVTQRTHEIGIRTALGARPADVLALLVRRGMLLTTAGLAAALLTARLVMGMLAAVSATDPAVYLGAMLSLGTVALAASYAPARRAAGMAPMAALLPVGRWSPKFVRFTGRIAGGSHRRSFSRARGSRNPGRPPRPTPAFSPRGRSRTGAGPCPGRGIGHAPRAAGDCV